VDNNTLQLQIMIADSKRNLAVRRE